MYKINETLTNPFRIRPNIDGQETFDVKNAKLL